MLFVGLSNSSVKEAFIFDGTQICYDDYDSLWYPDKIIIIITNLRSINSM